MLVETRSLISNAYQFLENRRKLYGNIFKSNVLGRKIVFLAGTEGAEAFYNSENISRSDAHPFPLVDLFGGINMEMYDGPKHKALKAMALTAFDRTAISGYLPDMQHLIESALERMSKMTEFSAIDELRKLAIEAICLNVLGMPPSAETETIMNDYALVITGLLSLPVSLPMTAYGKARGARDRLLSRIRKVILERRKHPSNDGLSRILAAKASDGRVYTDEEALLEVHHMVIAGFIVYALMAEAIRQLAEKPTLRERCLAEVREHSPSGPITIEALSKMRLSTAVILETKRYLPIVPLAFGRAQRAFKCSGFDVPEGWTVYLALNLCNSDPAIYRDPQVFDPDRFAPPRSEHLKHPMAFIPQGAAPPTGHQCLGIDYSTFLSVAFLAVLLRSYIWELPPQNLDFNWKSIPPRPHDGLRVKMRRTIP